MLYAAFLAVGFIVGLAAAVPVLTLCWFSARKIAELQYRNALVQLRQQTLSKNQHLENELRKVKGALGENLSRRHEQILEEELAAVITGPPKAGK